MANIFDRISLIVRSNVNDLLTRFEDPGKMIDQTIIDAQIEYARVKKDSLPVLANADLAEKDRQNLAESAEKWHQVAVKAAEAGNDGDAKTALAKEAEVRGQLVKAENTALSAKASAEKIVGKLKSMNENIEEMKSKAGQIKAMAATAKATRLANEIAGKDVNTGAGAAFARMEEKTTRMLAEAEALEKLNDEENRQANEDQDLIAKYEVPVFDADAAFVALKAEVNGKKEKGKK